MVRRSGNRMCHYDVRDFGAVGDSQANDTNAIQQAIEACAKSGGGIVCLHDGTFLTGGLLLKSHVELHLTSTAILLGMPDASQYHLDKRLIYPWWGHSLIFAENCEYIAITGQGTIDGQGGLFGLGKEEKYERPVLIRLRDCRNVRLDGILLRNSSAWAIHPIHCRQMRIEGVRIDNREHKNNDGIDIDGCQDVFISGCNIGSDDDSIALKTLEPGHICRDVVITNCILSSRCAAIRVGPDAVADIERICVSNCVIRDTGLNGIKIQESCGATMRDMVFSNIVMDNVIGPISIRLAGWKGTGIDTAVVDDSNWEKGKLRNILFENIRASVPKGKSCMSITGTAKTRPQQISFSNIDISFAGGGTAGDAARRDVPDLARDYPECNIFGVLPAYGLYVHHASGIVLNNVQFRVESGDFRPAIVCDDVEDMELIGFKADGYADAESLIRFQNVRGGFITSSRPLCPVGTFLQVEGADSEKICLHGNKLDCAGRAVNIAMEVSPDTVCQGV